MTSEAVEKIKQGHPVDVHLENIFRMLEGIRNENPKVVEVIEEIAYCLDAMPVPGMGGNARTTPRRTRPKK